MVSTAEPAAKPDSTGREMKRTKKPMRSHPATSMMAPVSSVTPATALAYSSSGTPASEVAMRSAGIDCGPMAPWRLVPSSV